MSQELSLQGYILKSQDLGEADLLLTFFAVEEGKVRFVVKAAKKMTSRLAGRLQPTSLLGVDLAGQGSLAKLIGVQMLENSSQLLSSQEKMAAVLVMQEFANRALPDNQPNPALFAAYTKALTDLAVAPAESVTICVVRFLTQGLAAIGLSPRLLEASVSHQAVYFSLSEGRFVVSPSAVDDLKISADVYQLYEQLLQDQAFPEITGQSTVTLLKLLNDFAAYQLERPLLAVQNFLNLTS